MKQLDVHTSQVYFRDRFVPFKEANLSITSSPVLYGLSTYTVFGAHWNEKQQKLYAFRLKDHYDRLVNSCKILDFHSFASDWTYKKFEATMLELLTRNKVREDALVRISVFIDENMGGTKIHDLKNSLSAFVYPMTEFHPLSGISACVSSWQRTPDNAIPARAKVNGSYVNASLMRNEALLNGYDDAISVDSHGHVAESTVANIFLVRSGVLITPDAATDILEGITRDSLLKIAKSKGIPVEERTVDRTELYTADEVFICGSSARITPVLSIDQRSVANGKIGPLTSQLMEKYKAVVCGHTDVFSGWRQIV